MEIHLIQIEVLHEIPYVVHLYHNLHNQALIVYTDIHRITNEKNLLDEEFYDTNSYLIQQLHHQEQDYQPLVSVIHLEYEV